MSQHILPCDDASPQRVRDVRRPGPQDEDNLRLLPILDERLRFETLLSRLSATFINLPPGEVDSQIERGLQQIVDFLGIERSSLAQFSEDGSALMVTHSYTVPGFAPFPKIDLALPLPWYTGQLRQGIAMRFKRLPEELPPEAIREKEFYRIQKGAGPQSHLAIPFKVGEAILGAIGFGTLRRERTWPDDLVQSLQLVGEVFANALERQRAEEARRRSDERFRMLLESTRAVPWVADGVNGRFTYVGPQAQQLLGYPLEVWYEQDFWVNHLHPADREAALAYCQGHALQQSDYAFDYRMVAADGRAVCIHDVVNVVVEDGVPRHLRGFMIDVTARQHAEEESRTLRGQLARVGRVSLMGELAASIAHEVNQPLCGIVSNAQAAQRLLAAPALDMAELRDALADIMEDGQRASAIIGRIRGFLQQTRVQYSPLDVNDLVRAVAVLMRNSMTRRNVAVKLELAEQLPPIQGDRIQLQQVIVNLMANGADAMDGLPQQARRLILRSSADGTGNVVVSVEDAGAGIEPQSQDRLFEPLFTTKDGGTGMGLAICKSIVHAHGGKIRASCKPGECTTFEFTLPGVREAAP